MANVELKDRVSHGRVLLRFFETLLWATVELGEIAEGFEVGCAADRFAEASWS